jgi:hypothetical protein
VCVVQSWQALGGKLLSPGSWSVMDEQSIDTKIKFYDSFGQTQNSRCPE